MASETAASGDSARGRKRGRERSKLRKSVEIEHVTVEEPFVLKAPAQTTPVGEGCYVSASMYNRRYYGVMVDQEILKEASMLYFQDESESLELNHRMSILHAQSTSNGSEQSAHEYSSISQLSVRNDNRQVQKFRYVKPEASPQNATVPGYRVLVATFLDVDIAADGRPELRERIKCACEDGGGFVEDYYYQFERTPRIMEPTASKPDADVGAIHTSLPFESFLHRAYLPKWFPLSNLSLQQQKILDLLKMKKAGDGTVVWDDAPVSDPILRQTGIVMKPRARFRVVVIGGGIAGLSCCLEILQACEKENIAIDVELLEARDRLGGRLHTDIGTFKSGANTIAVDLGASWIHGVNHNPLADLARRAGVEFVTTSEEVTMLKSGGERIDAMEDEAATALFDQLLDTAANDSWADGLCQERSHFGKYTWYAGGARQSNDRDTKWNTIDEFSHRTSVDVSVDEAVGHALASPKLKASFMKLSSDGRNMMLWSTKNIEYALGANIADLSMKFWDIDERNAFDGDHVILREGYVKIICYLLQQLHSFGSRFKKRVGTAVAKIQYHRQTTTFSTGTRLIDLSDTCVVTTAKGDELPCDFVVATVPLGVLKASIDGDVSEGIRFEPSLPYSKIDSVRSVGFGLLNKVYIQFEQAFWQSVLDQEQGQSSFGNASGVNPHYYMFFDVGRGLSLPFQPAILMTLVSGREANTVEAMEDATVLGQILETLRLLFGRAELPRVIAYKVTRWGRDPYARGSYTFLPPGTTDQDFAALQSPINGNGDSLLLDDYETMRLFFAGEHTSSLHPSMAHGALLSGIRAGKEVMQAMKRRDMTPAVTDTVFPVSLFRHFNPKTLPACFMCGKLGTRVHEGTLFAFRRRAKQVLVHNNCAEFSPEVEVEDGRWKNVIRACNRARSIQCSICRQTGASIGCGYDDCDRCFHYGCAEGTGWRFAVDGKDFACDLHRREGWPAQRKLSQQFVLTKTSQSKLMCALCLAPATETAMGDYHIFQQAGQTAVVHQCCIAFTNIVDTTPAAENAFEHDYTNVLLAVQRARVCSSCHTPGATIACQVPHCPVVYHYLCAKTTSWNFVAMKGAKQGFVCLAHRTQLDPTTLTMAESEEAAPTLKCASFADTIGSSVKSLVGNGASTTAHSTLLLTDELPNGEYESSLISIQRPSKTNRWNFRLAAAPTQDSIVRYRLHIESIDVEGTMLRPGDVVTKLNGRKVGSGTAADDFATLDKVLACLFQETFVLLEVYRPRSVSTL